MSHNKRGKTVLAFLAGAAVATIAGMYYLYGPRGREHREKVEFWVEDAKREIADKVERARDFTEDAYYEIVDRVTERYARMKDIGKEKAQNLADELKTHWAHIKEEADRAANQEDVQNVRRKIARRIDPDR